MSLEIIVNGLPDITTVLQTMSRRKKLSITAMVDAGGVPNGSLTSIGTGKSKASDMAIGPLLRVLGTYGYELVARSSDPDGVLIKPEGAVEMRVTGVDGGRLEVAIDSLVEAPIMLNTLAGAKQMTISGLSKAAGLGGGSLIAVARGTAGDSPDLRLGGLLKLVKYAGFELLVRPVHATRREARAALAAARRG